jgi:hypothetical protein
MKLAIDIHFSSTSTSITATHITCPGVPSRCAIYITIHFNDVHFHATIATGTLRITITCIMANPLRIGTDGVEIVVHAR